MIEARLISPCTFRLASWLGHSYTRPRSLYVPLSLLIHIIKQTLTPYGILPTALYFLPCMFGSHGCHTQTLYAFTHFRPSRSSSNCTNRNWSLRHNASKTWHVNEHLILVWHGQLCSSRHAMPPRKSFKQGYIIYQRASTMGVYLWSHRCSKQLCDVRHFLPLQFPAGSGTTPNTLFSTSQ